MGRRTTMKTVCSPFSTTVETARRLTSPTSPLESRASSAKCCKVSRKKRQLRLSGGCSPELSGLLCLLAIVDMSNMLLGRKLSYIEIIMVITCVVPLYCRFLQKHGKENVGDTNFSPLISVIDQTNL